MLALCKDRGWWFTWTISQNFCSNITDLSETIIQTLPRFTSCYINVCLCQLALFRYPMLRICSVCFIYLKLSLQFLLKLPAILTLQTRFMQVNCRYSCTRRPVLQLVISLHLLILTRSGLIVLTMHVRRDEASMLLVVVEQNCSEISIFQLLYLY